MPCLSWSLTVWKSLMWVRGTLSWPVYNYLPNTRNSETFAYMILQKISCSVLFRASLHIDEAQPISLDRIKHDFCSTRNVLFQMLVSHVVLLWWFAFHLTLISNLLEPWKFHFHSLSRIHTNLCSFSSSSNFKRSHLCFLIPHLVVLYRVHVSPLSQGQSRRPG